MELYIVMEACYGVSLFLLLLIFGLQLKWSMKSFDEYNRTQSDMTLQGKQLRTLSGYFYEGKKNEEI